VARVITPDRVRLVIGMALIVWAAPRPALAHSAPCSGGESLTTVGIGTVLGLLLFRPWRRSGMSLTGKLGRWVFPVVLASAVTVGACSPKTAPSAKRPTTTARLEIVNPTPNETTGPNVTLTLNLIGAKIVPATQTGGTLRGDEGHIHVTLDGKLISMAYGTTQDLNNLSPGPHALQAEFVATDHAPFANRVIAAVAFQVGAGAPSPS
jgi:hypothetical protein